MARNKKHVWFSDAVQINPTVKLNRGEKYSFVDMAIVTPHQRDVFSTGQREFTGSGSRFIPGDTLMARITPCLENGKVSRYCSEDNRPAFGSTEFIVIRGRPGITTDDFAYYLTQWAEFRNFAIGKMTGTSGRQRVPVEALSTFGLELSSIFEQQRMTAILGALDDKIALNRRMNRTLEGMARALFKEWFVDFGPVRAKAEVRRQRPRWTNKQVSRAALPTIDSSIAMSFPDGFNVYKGIEQPKGWERYSLSDLCSLEYGRPLKAENRAGGSIAVMGSNGHIGWHDVGMIKGPGIVVGRKGNPGIVNWVHCDFHPIDTTFYVVPKISHISMEYLFQLLSSLDLSRLSADSAVPGLNREAAYSRMVTVPDDTVLSSYTEIVSRINKRITSNDVESRMLAGLRDGFLPRLISGELRIKNADRLVGKAV